MPALGRAMRARPKQARVRLRRRVWQYAIRAVAKDLALPRSRWLSFPEMHARLRARRACERLHLQRLQAQREGADPAEVPIYFIHLLERGFILKMH